MGRNCGGAESGLMTTAATTRKSTRPVPLEEKMRDIAEAARFLNKRYQMPVAAHFKKAGSGFEQLS